MIDLITGHQGMPHISAKQISDLNNAMMEGYGADKIMRMKDGTITLTNNDVFTVNPGYWRVNGYDMEIQQTETIQIERPTGNLKRYDDIYIEILRDIPSGAERAELVKVEGSPAVSSPSHPPVPTEPELNTDILLLCIQVGYVYATSTYTTKHDDTIPYHYVSETEYNELLTHLLQEQYSRARMSSGNFAPIRVDDIIKLNTKGTWTHTDPTNPGDYAHDLYTLYSGNIVFEITSDSLGIQRLYVTTTSTSGYSEKIILFKGEVGIGTENLWLPRNGSQMPSVISATAVVNGEEYEVGLGEYYKELPGGVLTELYIEVISGISGTTQLSPTIRYKDDPTYTSSYPPTPTNNMLWNQIEGLETGLIDNVNKRGCKNILRFPYRLYPYGNTWITVNYDEDNAGSLTGSGTVSSEQWIALENNTANDDPYYLPAGKYVFYLKVAGSSFPATFTIRKISDNSEIVRVFTYGDSVNTAEFELTEKTNVKITGWIASGNILNCTLYPMLCDKSLYDLDPTWEPPSKSNQELSRETTGLKNNTLKNGCVNELSYPYANTSQVEGGITWIDNGDGSVTASSGTATSSNGHFTICTFADKKLKPNTRYKAKMGLNGSLSTYYMRIYNGGRNNYQTIDVTNNIVEFTTPSVIDNDNGVNIQLLVLSGTTVSNLTFKPIVYDASLDLDYSEWSPYAKSNRELTENVSDITKWVDVTSEFTIHSNVNISKILYNPILKEIKGHLIVTGNTATGNSTKWITIPSKYIPSSDKNLTTNSSRIYLGDAWAYFALPSGGTLSELNSFKSDLEFNSSDNTGIFYYPVNVSAYRQNINIHYYV